MNITKEKIQEIIDDDGNIIGTSDLPQTGGDKESEASHTTDYNVSVHGQNFKNDFLGRFGFSFYEAEEHEKPPVIAALMQEFGSEEVALKIMNIIKPHIEATLDGMQIGEGIVTESKVVEDKITDKKTDNTIVKKDKKTMSQRVEKVADLLSKLPATELDKLMDLLETKKKK